MNAMILAAGLGSRLWPMTKDIPKALVQINGVPLLDLVLDRLRCAGFIEIAVNAHHHADQVYDFINSYGKKKNFAIHYSYEEKILDTGGGIKKMLPFFSNSE